MKLFSCLNGRALLISNQPLHPYAFALCALAFFLCNSWLITRKNNLLHTFVAKLPFGKFVHQTLIFSTKSFFLRRTFLQC